jgi:hypothetical protein
MSVLLHGKVDIGGRVLRFDIYAIFRTSKCGKRTFIHHEAPKTNKDVLSPRIRFWNVTKGSGGDVSITGLIEHREEDGFLVKLCWSNGKL